MTHTRTSLSIPVLELIAGTRAAGGAGIGLLLADRLSRDQRRAVGVALLAVAAITTVPLLVNVLENRTRTARDTRPAPAVTP